MTEQESPWGAFRLTEAQGKKILEGSGVEMNGEAQFTKKEESTVHRIVGCEGKS